MGKPKKRTSNRKRGLRQSHLVLKLARIVNRTSPIKVYTTRRETGAKKQGEKVEKLTPKTAPKKAKKTTAKAA